MQIRECKHTPPRWLLSREQERILLFVACGIERGVMDQVEKNLVGLWGSCTTYSKLATYPRPGWKCCGVLQLSLQAFDSHCVGHLAQSIDYLPPLLCHTHLQI